MSRLVPERWREALEEIHDKVGHFLSKLVPGKKQEGSLERITVDALPALMQLGGPQLDMHETADELVIRAEMPGLTNDDFSVEIVGRRLTIHGEKKVVRQQKADDGCLISECQYGSFSRSVQLPYLVDDSTITAGLKHGVLTIRLPKPEQERNRRYKVPVS